MSNYKILFSLRVLKNILYSFVDSFLVLYFLDISHNNILPLGIHKIVQVTTVWVVIFLLRNLCKSKNRVVLLRVGIILDFVYFLTIILLKEKVVDYIYFLGFLYGLEEAFYYSVYNVLESNEVSNNERTKYIGSYTAVTALLTFISPIIFGSAINALGFIKGLTIMLVILILRIFLSFIFKDRNIPKYKKTNLKEYINIIKKEEKIKQLYKVDFFNGLTYSSGAVTTIITIYIIKIFSTNISLGVFTAIFNIITSILGILFAKYIKKEHYKSIIKVSMFFTITFLLIMIYKCNMITVVVFNLFQTFSKNLIDLINTNSKYNMANLKAIKKEYKVEYWIGIETALFLGRIISQSLFILTAFTNSNLILYIFIIFLILYAKDSMKLQEVIEKN